MTFMPPGMEPWAYDYASCPQRQATGGPHEANTTGRCAFCAIKVVTVQTPRKSVQNVTVTEVKEPEPEVARRGDWPKIARVPKYLRAEYYEARKGGIYDEYAQGLVAKNHGLEPGGRDTWTLQTLARLEFLKWLAAKDDYVH